MEKQIEVEVQRLEEFMVCRICEQYMQDANTVDPCLHSFCGTCIERYFLWLDRQPANSEKVKGYHCPICWNKLGNAWRNKVNPDGPKQQLIDELVGRLR